MGCCCLRAGQGLVLLETAGVLTGFGSKSQTPVWRQKAGRDMREPGKTWWWLGAARATPIGVSPAPWPAPEQHGGRTPHCRGVTQDTSASAPRHWGQPSVPLRPASGHPWVMLRFTPTPGSCSSRPQTRAENSGCVCKAQWWGLARLGINWGYQGQTMPSKALRWSGRQRRAREAPAPEHWGLLFGFPAAWGWRGAALTQHLPKEADLRGV